MSLQYVEIELDRPRKLLFRIADLRDLCLRLNGLTYAQLLDRLGGLDPNVIVTAMWVGLRHEDRNLTIAKVEGLLQDWIDRRGELREATDKLAEALNASGFLRWIPTNGSAPGEA